MKKTNVEILITSSKRTKSMNDLFALFKYNDEVEINTLEYGLNSPNKYAFYIDVDLDFNKYRDRILEIRLLGLEHDDVLIEVFTDDRKYEYDRKDGVIYTNDIDDVIITSMDDVLEAFTNTRIEDVQKEIDQLLEQLFNEKDESKKEQIKEKLAELTNRNKKINSLQTQI